MRQILMSSLVAGSALLSSSMMASAAVVYDPNTDYAIGISNFEFGFLEFDVHFRSGSYDDVYGLDAPLFLGAEPAAESARLLIQNTLNAEADVPRVSGGSSEILWIPTSVNASTFRAEQVGHGTVDAPWQIFADFIGFRDTDFSGGPASWLFATFEDTGTLIAPPLDEPPAVPLPSSILLLTGGLIGLGSLSRTRRKT